LYHNGDKEKTKEVLQIVEFSPSDKLAMLTFFLTAKSGHNISIAEFKEFFQKHQLHLGPEATVFNEPVIQGDEKMKVLNNLTK
jgi:hypothetical protein